MYPTDEIGTKILEHAKALFFVNGYLATEMQDIATAAHVSRSTLYRRFPTKEALALHISPQVVAEVFYYNSLQPVTGRTGWSRVNKLLQQYARQMLKRPQHIRYLAEFDNTFTGELPSIEAADEYINQMRSVSIAATPLSRALTDGIADGSVMPDTDPSLTTLTMFNALLAMGQRVLVREKRIKQVQGYNIELITHTARLLALGVKNHSPS